ncbi:MAG TPA: helix-turn-helix domain-containing protein [Candidatus Mediterraneibacter merdigallinarum]|nr:helix-turn-helix domain-containing protein [Candidatus Mediterraneibacter merdigallinarum]
MMSNTIGKNIKKLRRQNAVKQDVLASSLHMRRQTISSYERGITLPSIFTLIRIADFFNVTLDELTGRTELAIQKKEDLH